MAEVKVINLEEHIIHVIADVDDVRPYRPMLCFLNRKADFSFFFEENWQRDYLYNNDEWCNKMSVKLIEMVEIANELLKENEKELF